MAAIYNKNEREKLSQKIIVHQGEKKSELLKIRNKN